jgi:hypothetical protein
MKLLSILLALLLATTACRKKDDTPEPCKDTFKITCIGDICRTGSFYMSGPSIYDGQRLTTMTISGDNRLQISGTWLHPGALEAKTYTLKFVSVTTPNGTYSTPVNAFVQITGIDGHYYSGLLAVNARQGTDGAICSGSYKFTRFYLKPSDAQ